jgi:iron complex outermembrane receptor protein
MTSKVDRSRLPLAAAISTILAAHAQAQDAQRPQLEEVVVTGSLIRGTPEDSALPVKVFSAVELEESGSPSPLEFVKSLPISGPTTGESYYFGSSILTNDVRYNLRGIGRDKTLTLFNGRRAFLNAAVYPAGAIERIEILKDGAAVTYGADATGGVVNIITRESFEGVELSGSYKTYDGSEEGEWKIGATAGFNTQYSNFLFTAEWEHRSELDTSKRRFSSLPYWVNPAPSSNLTNLAGWVPRGEPPAVPTGATAAGEFGPSLLPAFGATLPEGMPVADFTKSSCEAVGGIYENPFRCHYVYIPYYNLVEENDVHRVFAQLTTKISDSADFRFRTLWARNYSPHQYGSPSQPVIRHAPPAHRTSCTYRSRIRTHRSLRNAPGGRTTRPTRTLTALQHSHIARLRTAATTPSPRATITAYRTRTRPSIGTPPRASRATRAGSTTTSARHSTNTKQSIRSRTSWASDCKKR